jgi:hypothetical protein
MPNPTMRDARAAALAKPLPPAPVFSTDSTGVRRGNRPSVGPATALQVNSALQAQNTLARTPEVAEDSVGATNAESATGNLSVGAAAARLANRRSRINDTIAGASQ